MTASPLAICAWVEFQISYADTFAHDPTPAIPTNEDVCSACAADAAPSREQNAAAVARSIMAAE